MAQAPERKARPKRRYGEFPRPVSVIMARLERRGLQSRDLALLRNDLLLDTLVSTRACAFNLRAGLARTAA